MVILKDLVHLLEERICLPRLAQGLPEFHPRPGRGLHPVQNPHTEPSIQDHRPTLANIQMLFRIETDLKSSWGCQGQPIRGKREEGEEQYMSFHIQGGGITLDFATYHVYNVDQGHF